VKIKATNTILYCKHWSKTVAFYRDELKLPVLSANEWFVEFKLNEASRLSVANEVRTSIKSGDGKGITISLQIEGVEQMRADLLTAGITPTPVKEVWGSRTIYVRDPEGNRLEFWEGRAKVERRSGNEKETT
jgi:catechol 2,3-dioxygenase-like lactoylglutathione lyase family enzyme